jgi:hypothetical protein
MAAAASLRLAALVLLAVLGGASHAGATIPIKCSTFTPYTIKIFNDTKLYNIWPVISTPTNGPDEWLKERPRFRRVKAAL